MLSEHVHTLIIVFKLSMTLQTTSAGRGKGRTWWNSMIRRPRVKNVDSAHVRATTAAPASDNDDDRW